jgi:hypothetical protein
MSNPVSNWIDHRRARTVIHRLGGCPAERLAALRQAFDQTMRDPECPADGKKISLEIRPVGWQESVSHGRRASGSSKTAIDLLKLVLSMKPGSGR